MPLPVKRALAKLGADIKAARRRRRITMALMAERAFVARSTLQKGRAGRPRRIARRLCHRAFRSRVKRAGRRPR